MRCGGGKRLLRAGLLAALLCAGGCAHAASGRPPPEPSESEPAVKHPVLLVHGLWNSQAQFARLREALLREGFDPVVGLDFSPNDGSAPIAQLAEQVEAHAEALRSLAGTERIDVVGFSMGALVTRYWIQRRAGRERTRRFISISGPHAGTWVAHGSALAGARQMRPGSDLLRDLAADADPWGEVEVHAFWTPWDLMILPARSSSLPLVRSERRFPVLVHRWMLEDEAVIDAVIGCLAGR